eukprot:7635044-Pyramimonas_sp.AAC.1
MHIDKLADLEGPNMQRMAEAPWLAKEVHEGDWADGQCPFDAHGPKALGAMRERLTHSLHDGQDDTTEAQIGGAADTQMADIGATPELSKDGLLMGFDILPRGAWLHFGA